VQKLLSRFTQRRSKLEHRPAGDGFKPRWVVHEKCYEPMLERDCSKQCLPTHLNHFHVVSSVLVLLLVSLIYGSDFTAKRFASAYPVSAGVCRPFLSVFAYRYRITSKQLNIFSRNRCRLVSRTLNTFLRPNILRKSNKINHPNGVRYFDGAR